MEIIQKAVHLIGILSLFATVSGKYLYEIKEIEVPLDHFSYANNASFKLRYLLNDTFAKDKKRSPIFFYTGNEGDIELFAENTGFQWELAAIHKAVVVFAEHRYYGKSLPFGNNSFKSPEYFGYLTAEQALADYAYLIDTLTESHRRPVIAFGGSYGGMLAAWFRMKYPHKVAGALAASAPIWQFTNLTKCDVFTKILTSVYATGISNEQGNKNCSINIKKSWEVFGAYSKTDKGKAALNKAFKFCKGMEITKAEDIEKFFDYLEDVYENLAMANYPYENTFLSPLPAYPIAQFCMYLKTAVDNDDLVNAMQQALSVYYNFTGKTECLDYKSAYLPTMGDAGWDIQTCNEMVMPICSGGDDDMFRKNSWSFKDYSDKCFAKYKIRPREREMVIRYGGYDIETASKIIFSNGLLDPWSGGGVMRTSNRKLTIIIIPEGAHHIDLRASHPKDPTSVSEARSIEATIIASWIKDFNQRTIY